MTTAAIGTTSLSSSSFSDSATATATAASLNSSSMSLLERLELQSKEIERGRCCFDDKQEDDESDEAAAIAAADAAFRCTASPTINKSSQMNNNNDNNRRRWSLGRKSFNNDNKNHASSGGKAEATTTTAKSHRRHSMKDIHEWHYPNTIMDTDAHEEEKENNDLHTNNNMLRMRSAFGNSVRRLSMKQNKNQHISCKTLTLSEEEEEEEKLKNESQRDNRKEKEAILIEETQEEKDDAENEEAKEMENDYSREGEIKGVRGEGEGEISQGIIRKFLSSFRSSDENHTTTTEGGRRRFSWMKRGNNDGSASSMCSTESKGEKSTAVSTNRSSLHDDSEDSKHNENKGGKFVAEVDAAASTTHENISSITKNGEGTERCSFRCYTDMKASDDDTCTSNDTASSNRNRFLKPINFSNFIHEIKQGDRVNNNEKLSKADDNDEDSNGTTSEENISSTVSVDDHPKQIAALVAKFEEQQQRQHEAYQEELQSLDRYIKELRTKIIDLEQQQMRAQKQNQEHDSTEPATQKTKTQRRSFEDLVNSFSVRSIFKNDFDRS